MTSTFQRPTNSYPLNIGVNVNQEPTRYYKEDDFLNSINPRINTFKSPTKSDDSTSDSKVNGKMNLWINNIKNKPYESNIDEILYFYGGGVLEFKRSGTVSLAFYFPDSCPTATFKTDFEVYLNEETIKSDHLLTLPASFLISHGRPGPRSLNELKSYKPLKIGPCGPLQDLYGEYILYSVLIRNIGANLDTVTWSRWMRIQENLK